jgi:hypothetical protein
MSFLWSLECTDRLTRVQPAILITINRKTINTINMTPILRGQEKSALPIPALVVSPLLFRL